MARPGMPHVDADEVSSLPDARMYPQYPNGTKPVPDPTALTTQAIVREIAMSRDVIETRLAGMDKAIELLRVTTDKFPSYIEAVVSRLQELHEEKFNSIQIQFRERDVRTEQTSKDSKVAIDAALQAQKEAVSKQNESNALAIAKSEAGFTKQIDQIGVIINGMAKGLDDKIDDIKGRLNAIEGRTKGTDSSWGYFVGAAGTVIAAITLIILITKFAGAQ